jgi:anti-sigma-K factor RskA
MSSQHDEAMLDLVAAYAVGAVDASTGECAAIRQHIAECAICREEFKVARSASAAIGLSAAQTPPSQLRTRVLGSLPSKVVPISRSRRSSWYIPAAAAAVIVIAAGVWWSKNHAPQPSWAAACVPHAAGCHASGVITAAGRDRMHMQINGLAALPAGKQYQAWVIPPGGVPKSEPVFSPDASGSGSVDIPSAPIKGAVVAVTVEPAGGSQRPTSKPFLVAKIE